MSSGLRQSKKAECRVGARPAKLWCRPQLGGEVEGEIPVALAKEVCKDLVLTLFRVTVKEFLFGGIKHEFGLIKVSKNKIPFISDSC